MDDIQQQVRRPRRLTRTVTTAGVITGIAAAFAVGVGVGHDGPSPAAEHTTRPVAFRAGLTRATSCDALLKTYVSRALGHVGAWGWNDTEAIDSGQIYNGSVPEMAPLGGQLQRAEKSPMSSGAADMASGTTAGTPATTVRQQNSRTGTNIQEKGVDEPDTVKTDGKVLVQVHDDEIWVYDVSGSVVRRLSSSPIQGVDQPQLLLSGTTLVVVGRDPSAPQARPETRLLTISLADPKAPVQTDEVTYRADLLSARQHGTAIRLVLDAGLPDLHFVQPHGGLTEDDALRKNRDLVKDSTIGDWLPTMTVGDDSPRQLIDCTDMAIPSDKVPLGTVGVVGFDAGKPTEVQAIGLAGATNIAYESTDHLYLATSGSSSYCRDICAQPAFAGGTTGSTASIGGADDGVSRIFDFALNGDSAASIASGEVEGDIVDRWSMDEADGVLRLAVAPTSQTGNFNSIVTLRKLGEDLVPDGRIDRLGVGEQMESVRWFDDLAILVTYRQVDPMYAVDLSHPGHLKLLGKLRLPGFSSYLHPLGPERMIGVGTAPDGGTQVALFDTSHLRHVVRLSVAHFANTDPLAASDPRSFTWDNPHRTAWTVLERWGAARTGILATLRVHGGRLHPAHRAVDYGDDVDLVRVVPLPDGHVVLVTGDDARFLRTSS